MHRTQAAVEGTQGSRFDASSMVWQSAGPSGLQDTQVPDLGAQGTLPQPQVPQVQFRLTRRVASASGATGPGARFRRTRCFASASVPQVQVPGLGSQGALPQPQVPQVQVPG